MQIIFRPLTTWPTAPTKSRQRSRFRAGYNDTLRLLDNELQHLRAKNVVIQLALRDEDIRLDGMPRAGAKPSHPGVILSFDSRHGPLSYPCDVFDDWTDNLRAIALSLEHLRAVDRYGVTKRGEQYQGWTALPPPKVTLGRQDALVKLCELSGVAFGVDPDVELLKKAYRVAALRHHPDRCPGEEKRSEWLALQEVKDVLEID